MPPGGVRLYESFVNLRAALCLRGKKKDASLYRERKEREGDAKDAKDFSSPSGPPPRTGYIRSIQELITIGVS